MLVPWLVQTVQSYCSICSDYISYPPTGGDEVNNPIKISFCTFRAKDTSRLHHSIQSEWEICHPRACDP